MKKLICISIVLGVSCLSQKVFSVTIDNPNYQIETYVQYSYASIGNARDFAFDAYGNIYVTHGFSDSARNGSIQKIDTSRTISPLRTDLVDPRWITYGGETDFGNNLYLTDPKESVSWSGGEVTQIDLNGNKSSFAGGVNNPGPLTINSTTGYTNSLYVANVNNDYILSVGPSGGTTSTFAHYSGTSGFCSGMVFDTTGMYENQLFASIISSDSQERGLFEIDPDGNLSRYSDMLQAARLTIDNTIQQDFDGKIFFNGKYDDNDQWSIYLLNGYYDHELIGVFDISPNWFHSPIQFGPDGAMYVMEMNIATEEVVFSRITPIPEPVTSVLLGFGVIGIFRKRKKI